jgi:uncharacterized membrane-anchored protein
LRAASAKARGAGTRYSSTPPGGLAIKGERAGSRIIYGIERLYIPEDSGISLWGGNYTARVKIDGRGNARIVELLRDGVPVEFRYERAP